jgi:hypothetical protein
MNAIHETEALFGKLDREFTGLKTYITDAVGHQEIHVVEKEMFRKLQQLGRLALECFLAKSGTGYQANNPPLAEDGQALVFKGAVESPYLSIFGEVMIARARYANAADEYFYPLDAQLNLPAQKYSYLLQQWTQAPATESDFREAATRFNEIFGFSFFPATLQRITAKVSPAVEPFLQQLEAPAQETEGTHLAISADGKGVPLVKSERQAQKLEATPKARRSKGEKPGIKKEAVVTVDFSFNPGPRDPEEIVKALLKEYTSQERQQAQRERQQRRDEGLPEPRLALNKHLHATLNGKEEAMNYLMARLLKRDPTGEKKIAALLDGDPNLENALNRALQAYQLEGRLDALILDIIHVSDYIWDTATALHGETGEARIAWVRDRLLSILKSDVGRVIGGLKQTLTKTKRNDSKKRVLQKTITYLENHRHMMDYASYLAKGYPIATGLVEAACRAFVKERLDQSGMHWKIKGAESILQLRAVMKNNDWEQFWNFYIGAEKNRLYADSYRKAA